MIATAALQGTCRDRLLILRGGSGFGGFSFHRVAGREPNVLHSQTGSGVQDKRKKWKST
jgi:hypothetical protein